MREVKEFAIKEYKRGVGDLISNIIPTGVSSQKLKFFDILYSVFI